MIRAIIFDYFGVIQPDVLPAAYRSLGGDPDRDAQFLHDTINALNHGHIKSSRPVIAERLGVSAADWTRALNERKGHDPELLSYILQLRKQYKIGLLSNIGPGGLQAVWPPGQLETYFDVAIASGDVGHVKPEPEMFLLMAQKLGVAPAECVMLDDIERHCTGAREAGMQAIVYRNFEQAKAELELLLANAKHKPLGGTR